MSEKMTNTYNYISSRATLNETLTAKYDGVFPQNTSKREIEHPRPFHMLDPPGITFKDWRTDLSALVMLTVRFWQVIQHRDLLKLVERLKLCNLRWLTSGVPTSSSYSTRGTVNTFVLGPS